MKKDFIALLFILAISILISSPLAKPGLHQMHDDQQVARLFLFDQSLRGGQFPVRWVDGLGFGFGYPLFVFYPPFVYVLGDIYHLIGFGFIDSIKLVFFSSIFASGLAMYLFAKNPFGKLAGLTTASFYILAPYRALDIYVRGALAESFSFVWLPLILWSFFKLQKTQKPIFATVSSIFLALLVISHNLIFMPFMLLLPIYVFYLLLKSEKKVKFALHSLFSIFLCFALSAFFWMPSLFEKQFTIVDQLLLINLANYKIHFAYPQQLWNSLWGFGGSIAGPIDGLSFKIGKLHILLSIASVILAMIFIFKYKTVSKESATESQLSVVFFALFAFSAFMTTGFSAFIWDLIAPLQYLQFPWRFLTFTTLFTSILVGALISNLKVPVLKYVVTLLALPLLFIPNFKLFKPQSNRITLTDSQATANQVINWDVSSSSFEYLPRNVTLVKSEKGTNLIDIKEEDLPKKTVVTKDPQAQVSNLTEKPGYVSFKISSKSTTDVTINRTNFPTWIVYQNGQKASISSNNKFQLIQTTVPGGDTTVVALFKDTQTRIVANLISAFSIIIITLYVLTAYLSKKLPKSNF